MRRLWPGLFLAVLAAGTLLAAQAPQGGAARRGRTIAAGSRDIVLLRNFNMTVDAMRRSGELVVRKIRTDTMISGRVHERYDQYANGLRVVGGEISRQMVRGVTESIYGELFEVEGAGDRPQLSDEDARERLRALSARGFQENRPIELVILPTKEGRFALAYTAHVWTSQGWMRTYLDAEDGHVIEQYNDLHTQAAVGTGTGVLGDAKKISGRLVEGRYLADDQLRPPVLITYDLQGNFGRAFDMIIGLTPPTTSDVANDADNVWSDGANVDAHAYLGYTYDYYFKRFGRRSLDDRDTPIRAVTHPARRSDYFAIGDIFPEFFDNAFWCGDCGADGRGLMVFGEGLPTGAIPGFTVDFTSGALDVVAHELTHGLTDYSSGLDYQNESGALNEAFSDMLGTSAEFFYQAPGTGTRQADYLIGEDVFRPGGIRSMSNPAQFGDPDHYSRRSTSTDDNGGVHTNSGIPNQAFYLAIEGGTNRTSGLGVTGVGGANREQIEKVFYRAFVFMLPSSATFSTARAATIQAARDLYGANSAAERAVTQAWTAVGVN